MKKPTKKDFGFCEKTKSWPPGMEHISPFAFEKSLLKWEKAKAKFDRIEIQSTSAFVLFGKQKHWVKLHRAFLDGRMLYESTSMRNLILEVKHILF